MPAWKPFDIAAVKCAAAGRWPDILVSLGGIDSDCLDGQHHPCPKCGGTDRFRLIDETAGACYCNQCFTRKNGDGIAALEWLTGQPFAEVLKSLAEYLHVEPASNGAAKPAADKKIYSTPQGILRSHVETLTRKHGPGVAFARAWDYGAFRVLRYDLPTPAGEKQRKEFRPVHLCPLGSEGATGWANGYRPGDTARPLYRLADLQQAADRSLLTIHGGEKATDAAAALSLTAITNAGGEKAIEKTDWQPATSFAVAAIVIDNDAAGRVFGNRVAGKLKGLQPDQTIKIVSLPGLPEKGDIVEWIAAGGTLAKFRAIVAATPEWSRAATTVQEQDDDPHRLARVYLDGRAGRIIYWRGEYWRWETYYRPFSDADLRCELIRAVKAEFDRLNIERQLQAQEGAQDDEDDGKAPRAKKVTKALISNVLGALQSLVQVDGSANQSTWLDGTERPSCVAMQNGIVDIDAVLSSSDDWLLPHQDAWFSPIWLPYPFDPQASATIFSRVMQENLEGDTERLSTLQQWAGYLLAADTSFQKFLILEGEGANGKSVYLAAMIAMLGRANVSHVPLEIFSQRFALTDTIGRLANISAECGELDKVGEGYLKSFTGGDRMMFDRKNLTPINAAPTARLMLATNNRPRFSDRSSGLWRRMLIVPFLREVPEADRIRGMDKPEWWERSGELPGIFNWAVAGLHQLRLQGRFTESRISTEALTDYRLETNPARMFLIDACQENSLAETRTNDLYDTYSKWCKANGYHPLGERLFGKEVFRAFPKIMKRRVGSRGSQKRAYIGLLITESDLE